MKMHLPLAFEVRLKGSQRSGGENSTPRKLSSIWHRYNFKLKIDFTLTDD